jgi:hypothetical protein
VHENLKSLLKYKHLRFFKYFLLLNISTDPIMILAYRNRICVLSKLIRKKTSILNTAFSNKIDNYAFNLNQYYYVIFDCTLKYGMMQPTEESLNLLSRKDRKVYCFQTAVKSTKLIVMRKTLINENKYLFKLIFNEFNRGLGNCLEDLLEIVYARMKYIEYGLDLNKISKLEKYFNLLIKVLLFYFLDLYRCLLDINQITLIFKVRYMMDIPIFEYDILPIFLNFNKLNNVISDEDLQNNKNYYEQVYLYCNIRNLYIFNNFGINCKNYLYIYKYMDILFTNLDILKVKKELDYEADCVTSDTAATELTTELNKSLEGWYKEWKANLYPLNKQTFHEVNEQRLKALNAFVLEEIKETESLK